VSVLPADCGKAALVRGTAQWTCCINVPCCVAVGTVWMDRQTDVICDAGQCEL
jgi:hypothetical protein